MKYVPPPPVSPIGDKKNKMTLHSSYFECHVLHVLYESTTSYLKKKYDVDFNFLSFINLYPIR